MALRGVNLYLYSLICTTLRRIVPCRQHLQHLGGRIRQNDENEACLNTVRHGSWEWSRIFQSWLSPPRRATPWTILVPTLR